MTVLKWLLVIFGVLFLAVLAVIIGGYYWASTVESVKLTADDLKPGGAYSPEERQELLDACQKKNEKKPAEDKGVCVCIADKSATEFSRFERLLLTAGFEGSATKFVAVNKGLIDSGIPQAEVDAMETGSKKRIDDVLKACGIEQK